MTLSLLPGKPPVRMTVTVEEAALTLGISRAFAYEAVARGEIPCIRIGKRILIPNVALERLLNRDPHNADSPTKIDEP